MPRQDVKLRQALDRLLDSDSDAEQDAFGAYSRLWEMVAQQRPWQQRNKHVHRLDSDDAKKEQTRIIPQCQNWCVNPQSDDASCSTTTPTPPSNTNYNTYPAWSHQQAMVCTAEVKIQADSPSPVTPASATYVTAAGQLTASGCVSDARCSAQPAPFRRLQASPSALLPHVVNSNQLFESDLEDDARHAPSTDPSPPPPTCYLPSSSKLQLEALQRETQAPVLPSGDAQQAMLPDAGKVDDVQLRTVLSCSSTQSSVYLHFPDATLQDITNAKTVDRTTTSNDHAATSEDMDTQPKKAAVTVQIAATAHQQQLSMLQIGITPSAMDEGGQTNHATSASTKADLMQGMQPGPQLGDKLLPQMGKLDDGKFIPSPTEEVLGSHHTDHAHCAGHHDHSAGDASSQVQYIAEVSCREQEDSTDCSIVHEAAQASAGGTVPCMHEPRPAATVEQQHHAADPASNGSDDGQHRARYCAAVDISLCAETHSINGGSTRQESMSVPASQTWAVEHVVEAGHGMLNSVSSVAEGKCVPPPAAPPLPALTAARQGGSAASIRQPVLHWEPLSAEQVQASSAGAGGRPNIWQACQEPSEELGKPVRLDFESLQEMFGSRSDQVSAAPQPGAMTRVSVLAHQRALAVEVILAQARGMTVAEVAEALAALDVQAIQEDLADKLATTLPTPDEHHALRMYCTASTSAAQPGTKAERWMVQTLRMKLVDSMLDMLNHKHSVRAASIQLFEDVQAALDACEQVVCGELLPQVAQHLPDPAASSTDGQNLNRGALEAIRQHDPNACAALQQLITDDVRDSFDDARDVTLKGVQQKLQYFVDAETKVDVALQEVSAALQHTAENDEIIYLELYCTALQELADDICNVRSNILEDAEVLQDTVIKAFGIECRHERAHEPGASLAAIVSCYDMAN